MKIARSNREGGSSFTRESNMNGEQHHSRSKRGLAPRVLFSIHGIRTYGQWAQTLTKVMVNHGFVVSSFSYGYLSFARFLLPSPRQQVTDHFAEWFRAQVKDLGICNSAEPADRPSIIAHSFGASVVATALQEHCDIRIDKLILCGSIIPCDFDWETLFDRRQIELIHNEVGTRDIWADLVRHLVSGTGASGRRGFNTANERCKNEQYEGYGHCDYLKPSHIEKRWLPVLLRS